MRIRNINYRSTKAEINNNFIPRKTLNNQELLYVNVLVYYCLSKTLVHVENTCIQMYIKIVAVGGLIDRSYGSILLKNLGNMKSKDDKKFNEVKNDTGLITVSFISNILFIFKLI